MEMRRTARGGAGASDACISREGSAFSRVDERDLRIFFARERPPVPWSGSSFAPMMERRAAQRAQDSTERPTPFAVHRDGSTSGAPWTEIVACAADSHVCADAERAFVDYIDARSHDWPMLGVLEQLTDDERRALAGAYGSPLGRARPDPTLLRQAQARYAEARSAVRA
jgi:hypothetical protein